MKKIAAFLLLFAIALQLVSCGPSRDGHVVTFVVNGNKTKVTVKDGAKKALAPGAFTRKA